MHVEQERLRITLIAPPDPADRHGMRRIAMTTRRLVVAALCMGLVFGATPAFARPPAPDCAKIEGSAIGDEGAATHIGDARVTFADWEPKAGERDE
jgi:hypothetical protein